MNTLAVLTEVAASTAKKLRLVLKQKQKHLSRCLIFSNTRNAVKNKPAPGAEDSLLKNNQRFSSELDFKWLAEKMNEVLKEAQQNPKMIEAVLSILWMRLFNSIVQAKTYGKDDLALITNIVQRLGCAQEKIPAQSADKNKLTQRIQACDVTPRLAEALDCLYGTAPEQDIKKGDVN